MRQISLAPITGKYSRPSGPTSMALGEGTFVQQHPRRAAAAIELEQPPTLAAFADEQPAAVDGDAVGRRDVVAKHPGAARGVAHADPTVHDLGGVEVALRVERHVVGRDDVAALGADGVDEAGLEVQGADLAAGHLRDVDPAVRSGAQTVRAEQSAGRGDAAAGSSLRQGWVPAQQSSDFRLLTARTIAITSWSRQ